MPVATAWAMNYWAGQDRLGPWAQQMPVETASSDLSGGGQILSVEPNRLRITAPAASDQTQRSVALPGVGIYRSSAEGVVLDVDDAIASYGRLRHYVGDTELPALRTALRGIVSHGTEQHDAWCRAAAPALEVHAPAPSPEDATDEAARWEAYHEWLWRNNGEQQ